MQPPSPQADIFNLELNSADRKQYDQIKEQFVGEGYDDNVNLHLLCACLLEMNRNRSLARTDASARKNFKDIAQLASSMADTLEKQRIARSAGQNLPKMFGKYMTDAEHYVREHIGEFSFSCSNCKEVLTTDGLPHWAVCWPKDEDGEIGYYKWSPEVLQCYNEGTIPMHVAAYILRTSPRAIMHTAQVRGDQLRECDLKDEEAKLRELLEHDVTEWTDRESESNQ